MFFPFYRYTDRPAKSSKAYNSVSTFQRICLPITPSLFLEISEGRYSSHFLLSYMTFASILLFGDTYKLALSCLLFAFWQICGFLTYIYLSRLVALICRATKSSTRSMPKSKIPVHFMPKSQIPVHSTPESRIPVHSMPESRNSSSFHAGHRPPRLCGELVTPRTGCRSGPRTFHIPDRCCSGTENNNGLRPIPGRSDTCN